MLATCATDLAGALWELGEVAEAARWIGVADRHAATDDVGAQFAARAMRARLFAHEGAMDEAEPLARHAAELASTTDALNKRAAAVLILADVLRMAGSPAEAEERTREAIDVYEQKGNVAAARRARIGAGSPAA